MKIPPFLDLWTQNKRKRFYLFEDQKLIFQSDKIITVALDKKAQSPALIFKYNKDLSLEVLTEEPVKAPILLGGARVNSLRVCAPTFFSFMGHEIFIDNINLFEQDFWFTGHLSEDVKEHMSLARRCDPVFLIGDTGTGKEWFAKNLHYNSSRRHQPFITVNCSCLDSYTAEKELFGNVRGAFTDGVKPNKGFFMNAGAGTVLLDNIENMPMNVQPMLLRSLELNEIKPAGTNALKKNKARIMVSSLMSPKDLLYRGCIRKDLYYRIEGSCVYLPELREIKNEIKSFVTFFMGSSFKLQEGVMELLNSYDWPGNIRELKNAVEKAKYLAAKDGVIKKSYFNMNNKFDLKHERVVDPNRLYTFENQERRFIFTSLNRNKWNIVDTARDLKLCRITLMAKIKHYGLKEQH